MACLGWLGLTSQSAFASSARSRSQFYVEGWSDFIVLLLIQIVFFSPLNDLFVI